MKKFIVLVLVLSLCAVGVFAQMAPVVHGDVSAIVKSDDGDVSANLGRLRLYVTLPVNDFTTVNLDLRNDAGTMTAATLAAVGTNFFWFDQAYVATNVAKALGLTDVTIDLRGGYMENWMSAFVVPTTTHRARQVETFSIGQQKAAVALDVGIPSAATLMTYLGYDPTVDDNFYYKVGLKLGKVVDGLNAIASYSSYTNESTVTAGTNDYQYWKVEASYVAKIGDGMTLTIPAYFLQNIMADTNAWGSGAKFMGMGATVGLEVGSKNIENDFLSILDVHAYYDVTKSFTVFAKSFMDVSETISGDFFEALDIGVRYNIGGNKIYLGYVLDAGNAQTILVTDDDNAGRASVVGGGLYLAWRVTF